MPCKKQVTIEQTSYRFSQNVWVHFGLPTSIVSDQDSHFLGEFWTSLWKMMDTKLKRSMAFHPKTNGHTEVVNRTVVHLLQGYCGKNPKLWDEHLSYVRIPTIEQYTHLCIVHHLRHVLATYQKILLIWSLEGKMTLVDMMTCTKHNILFNGSN